MPAAWSEADDDHAVRVGGERCAGEFDPADPVACGGDGVPEVEFAAVSGGGFAFHREAKENIAERLVVAHRSIADVVPVDLLRRVDAGPQRLLVELDALGGDTAEDHGTHPAIADGECLEPVAGGFVIP